MRLIIAGGRDHALTKDEYARLCLIDDLVDEVVSGGARGVDSWGELYGGKHKKRITKFPADWKNLDAPGAIIKVGAHGRYNANAGFQRNEEMAAYADALAVFPGGKGTEDMVRRARAHGLLIWDYR